MDFKNIIEAIDHLIETRVKDAGYTIMLPATIVNVVNSENNIYSVTCDNGKTTQIAIDIAISNNEIHYKKGESVQLLQLNGLSNTNTNLYILGKSVDISKKDIENIKSYFDIKQANELNFNEKNEIKLTTNIINQIKQYKSFVVSAVFSVDEAHKEEYYNYGLEIALEFKNSKNEIYNKVYLFDTAQMTGQPWNYNNTKQNFSQQLDDLDASFLTGGSIKKILGGASNTYDTKISDVSIFSAIFNEEDTYNAEFVNANKIEYITKNSNAVLKVNFYKNNNIFASNECKYYWYIKDANIDIIKEEYDEYGGVGWKCLNENFTNTYYDAEKNSEIIEKGIQNNIGEELIIDSSNAKQYHNYFKCVVVYGKKIISTSIKEVLNTQESRIQFFLTTNSNKITKIDENTILTVKLDLTTTDKKVNKIYWYYQKDIEKTRNFIKEENIVWGNVNEETKSFILSFSNNAASYPKLKEILGNFETTIWCDLVYVTSNSNSITQGTVSLNIIIDTSASLTTEVWFKDGGSSIVLPDRPEDTLQPYGWTKSFDSMIGPYIWAAERQISDTYIGNFSSVYCYSTDGRDNINAAAAAQLTEFNRLTNNGQDQGFYYGERYKITDDKVPISSKIYYTLVGNTYTKFIGSQFQNNIVYYERVDDGLYINADYINTGTLRIGDSESEKFYASMNSNNIRIGGFTVNESTIENSYVEGNVGSIGLSSDIKNGKDSVAFWAGKTKEDPNFKVSYNGDITCNSVFTYGDDAVTNWTEKTTPLKYQLYSKNDIAPSLDGVSYTNPGADWEIYNSSSKEEYIWYIYSSTGKVDSFKGPFTLQGKDGKDGKDLTTNIQTIENSVDPVDLGSITLSTEKINIINVKDCPINIGGETYSSGNWSIIALGWEEDKE